jgi:hypothetical protein
MTPRKPTQRKPKSAKPEDAPQESPAIPGAAGRAVAAQAAVDAMKRGDPSAALWMQLSASSTFQDLKATVRSQGQSEPTE